MIFFKSYTGGAIKDDIDKRDLKYEGEINKPANDYDYRKEYPPIQDQGSMNNCTNQGLAAVFYFLKQQKVKGWNEQFSSFYAWNRVRIQNNQLNKNVGIKTRDIIKVVQKEGLLLRELFEDKASYKNMNPHLIVPNSLDIGFARLTGWAADDVQYQRATRIEQINHALSKKLGIVIAIAMKDGMIKLDKNNYMQNTGKIQFGHLVDVVGKRKEDLIIRNSYGERWGEKGYCYLKETDLNNPEIVYDCYVISLK